MKVKIEIELEGSEDQVLIEKMLSIFPGAQSATEEVKPAKAQKTVAKAEVKEEPKAEVKEEPKAEVKEEAKPEPTAELTVDMIRALLTKKVPVWREDIRKKLNGYGAGNFTNLSPSHYADFYAYLQTLPEDGK